MAYTVDKVIVSCITPSPDLISSLTMLMLWYLLALDFLDLGWQIISFQSEYW